ncbi:MAG: hypothetical protein GY913_31580 [Proteobacteria bacterium]|nr:hypothetical protein [Pseudomonadota bacterium]MCP4921462.1 hypothetical protein [Pseudomonadota bacterium]
MLALHAVGAGLFAALVAIGATLAIERWGGVVGGFIGTLPSTVLPASIGIWLSSENPEAFQQAVSVTPVGMLLNAVFLLCWRVVPPRLPSWSLKVQLVAMVAIALSVWHVGAATTVFVADGLVDPLVAGVTCTGVTILLGIAACWTPRSAPKGRNPVSITALLLRGLLAASAIGVSVVLAGVGSPLIAGMASVFPAIFLTTMVSLWLSQGSAVPSGAVGPMMLGGSSVSVFALLAVWSFPALGPVAGAAVSWIGAVLTTTVPATLWLSRRPTSPSSS